MNKGKKGKSKKQYFRDQATADYAKAHMLAYSHGMQLRQCNSAHYQLRGDAGWLINIWPGTRKVQADPGHASPPEFHVAGEWTLVDLVMAVSGKTVGVAAQAPVVTPGLFPCIFSWAIDDGETEEVWEKEFTLPFKPRAGDNIVANGFHAVQLRDIFYDLDEGQFVVLVELPFFASSPAEAKKSAKQYGWIPQNHIS